MALFWMSCDVVLLLLETLVFQASFPSRGHNPLFLPFPGEHPLTTLRVHPTLDDQ